ncbi:MAG: zinc-finger domain-containing protein [Methylacidiphilales bacterium]|nr:zinc-finger domain-containing protein [Candidatus Methylacidiphilales bacterium]
MSENKQAPNSRSYVSVSIHDLPLHCPMDHESNWNSHPRVYLPIEDEPNGKLICPYCGTLFELQK